MPPIVRSLCILAALLGLGSVPARGQRHPAGPPRRPALAAEADTNDARAYYRMGRDLLARNRPAPAADAFHWASQLDPAWAEPLYARHVALLISQPRRLALYQAGDPRTLTSPEVLGIDSLYFRALRIDPFVQRILERELVQASLRAVLTELEGMSSVAAGDVAYRMLRDMPPLLRARVRVGEGRLVEALEAYDEALRERDVPPQARRYIRHERGRMFALVGNDSAALVELRLAVDAGVEGEREALVPLYDSKAVLHHSRGMIHERLGDLAAAREAYAAAVMEDLAFYPAHVRLAMLAVAEGDTAAAVGEMDLAARAAPTEPSVLYTCGALLARLARLDEAAAHLARAAELAPSYADPWLALAVVRDGQGSLEGAREAYQAFMARAPRAHRHRAPAEQRLRELDASAAPPAP